MKTILCFGDSNTYGVNPSGGRHRWNIRWPGRLQALLGAEYEVIEEGYCGRTTVWEDPTAPGRCGIKALPGILKNDGIPDLAILALGTNDCKRYFQAKPADIAAGMGRLCHLIRETASDAGTPSPAILLLSPVHILEGIEHSPYDGFAPDAPAKSRALAPLYEKLAARENCLFFDAAGIAQASPIDKLHMEKEAHLAIAQGLLPLIQRTLERI